MAGLVMLHVMLSSEQMADIERFREREGKRSRREGGRELIKIGLRIAADQETYGAPAVASSGARG